MTKCFSSEDDLTTPVERVYNEKTMAIPTKMDSLSGLPLIRKIFHLWDNVSLYTIKRITNIYKLICKVNISRYKIVD